MATESIVVIGAGVVGCAVAYALAREGRAVVVLDREAPAFGGASFGNVGHLATELVQPLPSLQLLFGFWRQLSVFGGPLDISLRELGRLAPWACRFALAAFHREENTRHLAPLVSSAVRDFERLFDRLGRPELIRTNGHYQIWFGRQARQRADREASDMRKLAVPTQPAPAALLASIAETAGEQSVAGLHFPGSGHVLGPVEVTRVLGQAAAARGSEFRRVSVQAIRPAGRWIEVDSVDVSGGYGRQRFDAAVVCAGAWSASLLASFGLHPPLQAAHGYHVDLRGVAPHVDAPVVYVDHHLVVTPMAERLRASSFMEFSGLSSLPDPRKPARLRRTLQRLGYPCEADGPSWRGPRPVLPDYLPAIGRARKFPNLCYAFGHQHLGLTLAPITAELIADLVAGRETRFDMSAFDLSRFERLRRARQIQQSAGATP